MTLLCAEADDICCQQTRKQQQQFNCEIYVVVQIENFKIVRGSSGCQKMLCQCDGSSYQYYKYSVHGELKEDCAIVQNSLHPSRRDYYQK